MAYNRSGYYLKAWMIQDITRKHFEPENHSKSRKAVWKRHIRVQFGICYRTFLSYLKVEIPEETLNLVKTVHDISEKNIHPKR